MLIAKKQRTLVVNAMIDMLEVVVECRPMSWSLVFLVIVVPDDSDVGAWRRWLFSVEHNSAMFVDTLYSMGLLYHHLTESALTMPSVVRRGLVEHQKLGLQMEWYLSYFFDLYAFYPQSKDSSLPFFCSGDLSHTSYVMTQKCIQSCESQFLKIANTQIASNSLTLFPIVMHIYLHICDFQISNDLLKISMENSAENASELELKTSLKPNSTIRWHSELFAERIFL
jgi:hypothetical protein